VRWVPSASAAPGGHDTRIYLTEDRAVIARATRIPSSAAETMPPA
jgi:hypothetical protein